MYSNKKRNQSFALVNQPFLNQIKVLTDEKDFFFQLKRHFFILIAWR